MSECLFCKIGKGLIPSHKRYEDESVLAFNDLQPQAPVHILIIPKKHVIDFSELNPIEDGDFFKSLSQCVAQIALETESLKKGYRLLTNKGEIGGQSVFHLHFHLLGGRAMLWPPG